MLHAGGWPHDSGGRLKAMKRRIVVAIFAAFIAKSVALGDEPAERVRESVTAERVIVDVRVIDNLGNPITGLGVPDFSLRVDGHPVSIESVEWMSTGTPAPASDSGRVPEPAVTERRAASTGRLVVLFFQNDYEHSRITGQMRMIRQALAFLETCSPEDRLAVLSFDSRLKLRQDFTGNREMLRRAIRRTLYADDVPEPPAGVFPSLAASLDFQAARKASLPEHALRVIGQGLAALPGPKSLLFFGWGIGNFDSVMGLILDHNYGLARAALLRSQHVGLRAERHDGGFSLDGGRPRGDCGGHGGPVSQDPRVPAVRDAEGGARHLRRVRDELRPASVETRLRTRCRSAFPGAGRRLSSRARTISTDGTRIETSDEVKIRAKSSRFTPGVRLGPYEILAPLGAGGMGEVYRARDSKLNRDVAIKVLPESLANDRDALARFEREAHAVAALNHPNILSIHDFVTHEAAVYAVMELLEGEASARSSKAARCRSAARSRSRSRSRRASPPPTRRGSSTAT